MSYISKEQAAAVRAQLKKEFPNLKFSVRVDRHSSLSVSIMSGDVDFAPVLSDREYTSLNTYRAYEENADYCYNDDQRAVQPFAAMFNKIVNIMKSQGWYDNSDAMTDYFDTSYYVNLSIGQWDKPYVLKA